MEKGRGKYILFPPSKIIVETGLLREPDMLLEEYYRTCSITGHAVRGVLPDMLLEEYYRTCC